MFMDSGGNYLTPAKPAFKNPPSRYRRPTTPGRRYEYESPSKKYRKPPKPSRPGRRYAVPGEFAPTRRDGLQPMQRFEVPRGPSYARTAFQAAKWVKPVFRVHPLTRVLSYAWDAYDAVSQPQLQPEWYVRPERWVPAPGYICYSYNPAIDNGSCDEYHLASFASTNSTVCSTWHYQNQAFSTFQPTNRGRAWGPKQGGVYGCLRYNMAHVAAYPDSVPAAQRNPTRYPRYVIPVPEAFTSPLPDPAAFAEPAGPVVPPPDLPLYAEPAIERRPNGQVVEAVHYNVRPKPGEKERKRRVPIGAAASLASKIFHAATEGMDFVDVIFEALPKNRQEGAKRPDQKLKAIWDYFDELDWGDVAANFVINQLEDRIVGTIMSAEAGGSVTNRYKAGTPGKLWK